MWRLPSAKSPKASQANPMTGHSRLGAGAAYSPDYEGSNDYDIKPLPLVEVSWRDVVKIGSLSGPPSVSFKFLEVQGPKPKDRLKFTASLGYLGGVIKMITTHSWG